MKIKIMQSLLHANDEKAKEVRNRLADNGVKMINIIGSPGCGKTALLEGCIPLIKERGLNVAVIEGDIATERDAERLVKFNIPVATINTDGACHIESVSIDHALDSFDLKNLDMILVENVGNLVCPAEFYLGENARVAIVSLAEGEDKVAKYPLLFKTANLLLLNKIDLEEYLNFLKESFYNDLKLVNSQLKSLEISAKKGTGLNEFVDYLVLF